MRKRVISDLFLKVLETLNEAQARWYVAREAIRLGRGGLKAMQELTGMSRPTILKGMRELRQRKALRLEGGARRPGGGRRPLEASDPKFGELLEQIVGETPPGEVMSLLKWTTKSTARIAEELTRQGHPTSDETVRRRLKQLGYFLQANVKGQEEASPAARAAQFQYMHRQVREFLARKDPVIWIETKQKEFKNPGRGRSRKGQTRLVNLYDFPPLGEEAAIPDGSLQGNPGFVNVGITHDAAEFAVESLRRWWRLVGRRYYPQARSLLLCAAGGGSHPVWKFCLQALSDEWGIPISVCHYPPGTSKWHKIEHRMVSFLSLIGNGQSRTTYETVLNLIAATRTRKRAKPEGRSYEEARVTISDQEMASLRLQPHDVHPQWNYTIAPREQSRKSDKLHEPVRTDLERQLRPDALPNKRNKTIDFDGRQWYIQNDVD